MPQTKLNCKYCDKMFCREWLKKHLQYVHGVNEVKGKMYCAETGCEARFIKRIQIIEHLKEKHGITTEVEHLQFNSMNEFENWLEAEEKSSVSKYVQQTSEMKRCAGSTIILVCSRDGNAKVKPHEERKRALKNQGSRKCGNTCTSHLVIYKKPLDSNPNVVVKYYKTHYSHNLEVQHLTIANSDRLVLASQLAIGVSENTIIKHAFESSSSNPSATRMDTITRKDLANIRAYYGININGGRRDANEMEEPFLKKAKMQVSDGEQLKMLLAELVEFNNSKKFDSLPVENRNEILQHIRTAHLLSRNMLLPSCEISEDSRRLVTQEPFRKTVKDIQARKKKKVVSLNKENKEEKPIIFESQVMVYQFEPWLDCLVDHEELC